MFKFLSVIFLILIFSHFVFYFIHCRTYVREPMDLGTITSEAKMCFYGTDHALFAKVNFPETYLIHFLLFSPSPAFSYLYKNFFPSYFYHSKYRQKYEITYELQKVRLVWGNCKVYNKGTGFDLVASK